MRPKFSRWVSLLGKFRSDARGVTAIEFAMLSPAFFLLLFGIIETSIIFIGDMTLEKSTMTMARHVRVGTVSKENMTSEEFRRQLCQGIVIPMKCSELGIDLRSYSTFAEIQTISGHEPVQAGTTRFEEIRPGDVVWFPPGEKHWHGASPTVAMTHIAIQEQLDGKMVDWLEKVTDAEYGA